MGAIKPEMEEVLSTVEFSQGHRYEDFDPDLDSVAAYGIGGLIAGKVLAKAGIFAVLLKFLIAAKKLLIVAAIFVKKLLGCKPQSAALEARSRRARHSGGSHSATYAPRSQSTSASMGIAPSRALAHSARLTRGPHCALHSAAPQTLESYESCCTAPSASTTHACLTPESMPMRVCRAMNGVPSASACSTQSLTLVVSPPMPTMPQSVAPSAATSGTWTSRLHSSQ